MMERLDFGLAMLKAKSTGKERPHPEKPKMESPPKPVSQTGKDLGKRMHLIFGSWLKNPPKEKILLPSSKELESLWRKELILKR